jgi:hypothetical protein
MLGMMSHGPANPTPPFLTRVKLRNYKSIGRCDTRQWIRSA